MHGPGEHADSSQEAPSKQGVDSETLLLMQQHYLLQYCAALKEFCSERLIKLYYFHKHCVLMAIFVFGKI